MIQIDEKVYGQSKARIEQLFDAATFVELGAYTKRTNSEDEFESVVCGYGAVGTTRIGCGAVPSAPQMYPFYFEGEPISHKPCDFVVIKILFIFAK